MNAPVNAQLAAALRVIDAEIDARSAARAKTSLHAFTREFWSVVEGQAAFVDNWHIRVICEHLEAVSRGEIKNLLINVPPGTSKSTLVSVMWPAWEWASNPALRYFGASYSEPLSIRDALLCRDIISSDKYRRWFPEVRLKSDANQKTHYALESGGWRLATSVGGRGTGMHPHRKIVDDPHNVKQAVSDVERQNGLDWFDGTLSSRGLIFNAPTVVVMQRLHERDLTGHIMKSTTYSEWDHLVIPMRYEPERHYPKTKLGYKDPRTVEDELLWPVLFTEHKVDVLSANLGEYGTAGQLQQRPAPAGGGILKIENFRLWPAPDPKNGKHLPDLFFVLQSYDTAFTERTEGDPSAGLVWGVGEHTGGKRFAILLDAWDEHLGYPALRKKVMDDWGAEYGGALNDPMHPSRRADICIVEKKGSGQSLLQDLRQANVPVFAYDPGRADKLARANIAAPLLELGLFYVIESRRPDVATAGVKGRAVKWARKFLEQCEQFPNGEHDDYVDTFSQAAIYLKDAGFLELPAVDPEEPAEKDYYAERRAKVNPYG